MKKEDLNKLELLKELCDKNQIKMNQLSALLDSVKIKKLIKRNNYHTSKIIEIIENEIK
jgi:hypothetical protein